MNRKKKRWFLFCSVIASTAFALGVLFANAGLAQQPAPRKAPITKAPAKATATPAAAAAVQPKYKGIWEPVNYKENLQLTDVFFVSADVGWVTGAAGTILKTTDGGATWTAQLGGDPQSKEQPMRHLRFLDETHGWAFQGGKLLRTTDGENWEQVWSFPDYTGYVDYMFTSETEAFALVVRWGASRYIWRTQDGGQTWKEVSICQTKMEVDGLMQEVGCRFLSVHFPSPNVGYAVGGEPMCGGCGGPPLIAKTQDGGGTWNISVGPGDFKTSTLDKVFFIDESTGFVHVAQGDKLYATTDGGQTWRGLVGSPSREIKFADPEVAWSFDGRTLSYTTDSGKRWFSRDLRFPANVNAFSLPRRDRAYVVGDHGMIYRYRVVPVTEEVAKSIPAPAMPGVDSPLDEQVEQLQGQVAALEEEVKKEQGEAAPGAEQAAAQKEEAGGGEAGAEKKEEGGAGEAGNKEGGGAGSGGSGLVENCCAEKVEQIQATVDAVAAEVPKFTGKYRNLNLIFSGLRLVGQLFGQAQTLKDSFNTLRKARDPQSVTAALTELTNQVTGLVQNTKTAFQKQE